MQNRYRKDCARSASPLLALVKKMYKACILDIDGTLLLETSVTWKEDTAALGFMIHTSGEQLEK